MIVSINSNSDDGVCVYVYVLCLCVCVCVVDVLLLAVYSLCLVARFRLPVLSFLYSISTITR